MDYVYVHVCFSCFCPCNWGTRKRVDTAPKASGCFLGVTQESLGAVSEDLLGGTGKAEDAKLPGAGIIPKLCPMKGRNGGNGAKRYDIARYLGRTQLQEGWVSRRCRARQRPEVHRHFRADRGLNRHPNSVLLAGYLETSL